MTSVAGEIPTNPAMPFLRVYDPQDGYRFVLSGGATSRGEVAAIVGERFAALTQGQFPDQRLDAIGIAYTGLRVAGWGMLGRSQRGLDCRLMDIYLNGVDNNLGAPRDNAVQMIVDNSLRTGTTLVRAIDVLRPMGFNPEVFCKLVDYQDEREGRVQKVVQDLGLTMMSLFTADELRAAPYRSLLDRMRCILGRALD